MSRFDEVVDELYGLAPDAFVKRRNELAREAKADGDRELAGRIDKLRRPTQAAWAINQWVRAHPDDSALIAELASELTVAQRRSAVDKMRALSRRRQELINSSVTAVARAAADRRVRLADSAIREVTQTLRAAVADRDVLEQVVRGNLTASAEYSGFGPAGVFVVPEPSPEPDRSEAETRDASSAADDSEPSSSDDTDRESDRERRELEARLTDAEAGERAARSHLEDASDTVDGVSSEVDEIVGRAQELRAELARCEESLRFARQRLSTAEQGRSEARIALREAVAATNEIRAALAEL
ncbi:hypothetical protein M1C59_13445 [Gordonia terrae]|uniref:hypothetical protein n=1 Tax=Gordonia terrae TaxID=2055 RepID=UPI00200A38E3|nr:hypothetical protein [Gordonia terrae]UPW11783.1 hypothetical protein M1C59_13445 [Gordonia terrae]